MTEELAVEERLGETRAVDGDEGMLGEGPALVDCAGDQLLAGAALAAHQHGALVPLDGLDDAVDPLQGAAPADQLAHPAEASHLLAQPCVLAAQGIHLQHALDGEQDLLRTGVLDQVVRGAELHRLDGALDRAVAGQDDDHGGQLALVQGPQELHAVHHRHFEVRHDHVEQALAEPGERRLAVRRVFHRVARALEVLGERARHVGLVLHEEDARTHRAVRSRPPRRCGRGRGDRS